MLFVQGCLLTLAISESQLKADLLNRGLKSSSTGQRNREHHCSSGTIKGLRAQRSRSEVLLGDMHMVSNALNYARPNHFEMRVLKVREDMNRLFGDLDTTDLKFVNDVLRSGSQENLQRRWPS
jgi:hypothetical protein